MPCLFQLALCILCANVRVRAKTCVRACVLAARRKWKVLSYLINIFCSHVVRGWKGVGAAGHHVVIVCERTHCPIVDGRYLGTYRRIAYVCLDLLLVVTPQTPVSISSENLFVCVLARGQNKHGCAKGVMSALISSLRRLYQK